MCTLHELKSKFFQNTFSAIVDNTYLFLPVITHCVLRCQALKEHSYTIMHLITMEIQTTKFVSSLQRDT